MRVPIRIANNERRDRIVEVPDALVDTGATWTILPRLIATELGLPDVGRFEVRTAAGPQVLEHSYAYIELDGKSMVERLLVSDTLDIVLIGVTTLEALGLAVDPGLGQLTESEVLLLSLW